MTSTNEMNKKLLQQVNSLTSTVDSLNATINVQTQLIAQLNQTIQELKEQLNKNSKNSSKPPSSDGFKKPAPKSLRKPSGKKAGGQNGHQGTHLAVITAPDKIVKHMPSACEADNKLLFAGYGYRAEVEKINSEKQLDYLSLEKGIFNENADWIKLLDCNGDEQNIRMEEKTTILRAEYYEY